MNDLEINCGPIEPLLGEWGGTQGIARIGNEVIEFDERMIVFNNGITVTGEQSLVTCPYNRYATTKDGKPYHQESGYFLWDADRDIVYRQATVPRGFQYIGQAYEDLDFLAIQGEIGQSMWLSENFKLERHQICITPIKNGFSYAEVMSIIEGEAKARHSMSNTLFMKV